MLFDWKGKERDKLAVEVEALKGEKKILEERNVELQRENELLTSDRTRLQVRITELEKENAELRNKLED